MRKPKIGDVIIVSEYYDENGDCLVRAGETPDLATIVRVLPDHFYAKSSAYGIEYQILDDEEIIHTDDVWRYAVPIYREEVEDGDLDEEELAAAKAHPIVQSFGNATLEYVPQSFSDFNASSGGGKTLKDYTGVGFTKEELAFKSSHEKAIESLTADSLAFSPIEEDDVNHPSHYNYGDIEVIDMLEALSSGYSDSTDAYLISTAAKYLYRADHKGKKVEDWKKAVWYIERAIEREEAHNE